VDRWIDGKFYPAKEPLSTRPNDYKNPEKAYLLVDIRTDEDIRAGNGAKTTISMQKGVLRSHAGEPGPGEETLHGPGGPQDNRWPENIRWGTHPENVAERVAANPRAPKPLKVCPVCEREHTGRGRRCPECVAKIGVDGALLIAAKPDLEEAAKALDYPSAVGVFNLAVKHGGLRVYVDREAATPSDPGIRHSASPQPWLRRVINRWEASRRNSDAR
jgi:hypothetical protein